jgi:hypothetical protein
MNRLHLQPVTGRVIRHPDGHPLALAGELVPPTTYWLRRLACGDVVEVAPPPTPEPRTERAVDPDHRRGSGKASP